MTSKLKEYIKSIDLVKYLKHEKYGYIESNSSTPEKPQLENKENTEFISVRKNKKDEFIYWSSLDNNLKGKNIVDFVTEKHSKEFYDEIKLSDVENIIENNNKENSLNADSQNSIDKITDNRLSIAKDLHKVVSLKDRTPLYEKGLSDKTIDSPLFDKLLYNIETDPLGVGCIMINEQSVQAVNILTNDKGEKSIHGLGSPENSIMCSNLTNKPPIDTLIITSSMEEAMAHYESNFNGVQSENIRYIATGKEPTLEQLRLIQKNIDELNPATLVVGTSNTLEGEFANNKILSKLNIGVDRQQFIKEANFRGYIDVEKANDTGLINITLPKDLPNFEENLNKLLNTIEDKQKQFQNLHSEGKPFTVEIDQENKKDAIVHLKFNNSKINWKISADLIHEVKLENHPFIRRDVSDSFNFNDDLKFEKEDLNLDFNNEIPDKKNNNDKGMSI